MRQLLGAYLPRGAIILASLTLGSSFMGLLRDRVLAQAFGAGPELDAYNAAFVVPELLLDILVAGGVQAALVPIFTGLRGSDERAATVFGRTVIGLAVMAMLVVAVALFVGAPALASAVVPGFDPVARESYVTVLRIIAITPAIFAASIAVGEILVAHRRFVGYGLAPILYNGGIAAGTVLLAGRIGVAGPALGAVAGAILHLAVRLWDVRGTGFSVRPALAVRTRAFREFILLSLPRMFGEAIEPLTRLVFLAIASTLVAGSVTAVVFAWNFESAAVSLIGIAFAVVAFPVLSTAAVAGDRARFRLVLRRAGVAITALSIAAAVALAALGTLVIELFLGGGAFDASAVARTGLALAAFAVAVPFASLTELLARAVYATHNTLLPVAAAAVGFGVMALAAPVLAGRFGLVGIPLAYAAGYAVRVGLLVIVAGRRISHLRAEVPTETLAPGTA